MAGERGDTGGQKALGQTGEGGRGDVWSGYATETHDKVYKYTLVEVEGEINMV